jgi:pimeloyl-ACP methyl ester carboxylesterase
VSDGLRALRGGAGPRLLVARGEPDPMVWTEQLAACAPEPVVLPGCGHGAHVERPDLLLG